MSLDVKNKKPDTLDFDKLWDYNDPAETEKKFREIIPRLEAGKNPAEKSAYLQLQTQIARTLGLQMKFDEAHKLMDDVQPLLTDEDHLAEIRYLLERGRIFNSSNQKDKARELFLKAYELAGKNNEASYAVDAAHMMGIVEPCEESLQWNECAINLAEKSEDERARNWLGSLYNNTAWTYYENKEYTKALELFEKTIIWYSEKKSVQYLNIAKWSVAKTLRSLNRIDEAVKIHNNLLKEIEEKSLDENGYIYEELGECCLLKGNKEDARVFFGKAYDLLSKDIWLAEYEKDRLERIKELGGR